MFFTHPNNKGFPFCLKKNMQNYPYTFNARLLETFINLCMRCVLHVCTLYLDLWGVATSVYLLHVRRHIVRSNRLQSNKTDAFFFSFWILLLVWAFPSQRQQLANYNFNKAICTTSHTIVSRLAHFLSSFLCFSKYNKCTMTSLKAKRKKKPRILWLIFCYITYLLCVRSNGFVGGSRFEREGEREKSGKS